MKRITFSIVVGMLCFIVQGQELNRNDLGGSWINKKMDDYYASKKENACNIINSYGDDLVPLWLSFENKNQLKITFKIEQRIFIYKIKYYKSDSIFIYREGKVHRIYISNNVIRLQYNHNLITFKKVSDSFSSDIFGEYIKNSIFESHKSYLVSFFKGKNVANEVLDRFTVKQKIKELFGCDQVDFVQLGSFKFRNICLPEIALYYNNSKKLESPQVMGILINTDSIQFIDRSGANVLTLKPK